MERLPTGWELCQLEDCVEILDSLRKPINNKERNSRIQEKDIEELYPYYGATGQVGYIDDYLYSEELVTLGEDAAPFLDAFKDKAYILKGKTWVNNHAHVLKGSIGVSNKYICHFLNQFNYYGHVNGATRLKLTQASMRKIPVMLASSSEQTRIANKLDSLLTKIEAAQTRLEKIPSLLKRFRQSVLAAATSGELTKEWRKENVYFTTTMLENFLPLKKPARYNSRNTGYIEGIIATAVGKPDFKLVDNWEWIPLVDIAVMGTGHTPNRSKPEYWGGDVCWIGIKDARKNHTGTIFGTVQKTNELGLLNSAARILPQNTVCISRTASVGYVVKMGKPMATSQDFVTWTPTEVLDPDWLKWLFVSEKESLFKFGKGTTHTTVYFSEWLSIHVALPPLEEQKEIVRRVESLFTLADTVEKQYNGAKKRTDKLTQSILAKAFKGELVPQDPNDESAEKLLERIKDFRKQMLQKQQKKKRAANKPKNKQIKTMKLDDAPNDYLTRIIKKNDNKMWADELWKASNLSIDDFYEKLCQEVDDSLLIEAFDEPEDNMTEKRYLIAC